MGDNLWAGTIEARAPFTSVMRPHGSACSPSTTPARPGTTGSAGATAGREEGVGGGIFLVNPFFQFQLSVARGLGLSTRVHVSTGVNF